MWRHGIVECPSSAHFRITPKVVGHPGAFCLLFFMTTVSKSKCSCGHKTANMCRIFDEPMGHSCTSSKPTVTHTHTVVIFDYTWGQYCNCQGTVDKEPKADKRTTDHYYSSYPQIRLLSFSFINSFRLTCH